MIRVCVIDDDYDVSEILKEELEMASDQLRVTRIAHNMADAKRTIDTFLPLLDCFIIDIAMPASSADPTLQRDAGLHVLTYLRQTKRFAGTIIVVTGSVEFGDGKKAFELGCDAYLCKTRDLPDLIDAIQFCIERRVGSPEMQHLLLPAEITSQEARLLEMLTAEASWQQIALSLRYGNAGVARNAADEAFNKILAWHDVAPPIDKKREVALQLWKWRHVSHAPAFETIDVPHRSAIGHNGH